MICLLDFLFFFILVLLNVRNFDRCWLIWKIWGIDYLIEIKWKIVFFLGKNNNERVMENVIVEFGVYGDIV